MFPRRGYPNGFFHPCPQDINPSAYPADFRRGDEDMGWVPQDHQQAANWDYRHRRCEEGFRDRRHSPFSRDTEPYPADFYGGDNGGCWAPQDHPQPARWENQPGRHEEGFRDGWHLATPPNQHCPKSVSREEHGNSWDREQGFFPRKYGRGWKHHRGPFRGGYWGKFDPHYHRIQSCSSREKFKSSRSSASRSPERCSASSRKKSVSSKTEKAKTAAPKKPGKSKKDSTAPVEVPKLPQVHAEASQTATDPSSQAGSALDTEPPESPETTEDLYPMRTEGTELVQLEASHEATDRSSQAGSDLAAEPPAPPETTEELHPIRTEDTELLQLEDNLKASDLLSQAVSALATLPPVWSEITEELPPVGKEEIELINLLPSPCLKSTQEQLAAHQEEPYQACSALAAPSETMEYLRSAAILARKEEIELSYQQSSLAFAVVATMLLQKEPSMEAAMGSALRANLRQVGGHCLQELEHFIRSYDSGSARL
ncbi:periphilin-1-like isoform X10 [Dermochelys coriacea]|uniref:periphilin-1-like isoform X10 n=1 Tax=Dermochelys coriacea TaxID=27794 RepID=UPI001CA8293D|nr:periphilin-1-like isoform X10 [Dermochelys coriacea]